MKLRAILLFVFIVWFANGNAGSLDSLRVKLVKARNDSVRIELIYKASFSKKLSTTTVDSLHEKILEFKHSKDCYIRSFCFYKIGAFYAQRENPALALDHLLTALKIADSCRNNRAVMLARNKLGLVNKLNMNFKVAINHAHISLTFAHQLKDSFTMADNYTLLGNIYKTEMKIDSALHYHYKALAIREILNDRYYIALTYNNLGLAYKNKKEYDKALDFLRRSLALKIEIKDKTVGSAYNNIAIVYKHLHKFDSAIYYSQKVIVESHKYKNGRLLREAISALAEVYDDKKDIPMAYHYFKRLNLIEDSVGKETISAQYQELQSKYESDKKDSELKSKENSLKLAAEQNSKKNTLILFSSIALLMAVVAAIFIFRSYKLSKKNARQLSFKNKLIEEKNKEITDSINYAKNIQQSLLTSEIVFNENVKDHFVFFQPKDIVSGDFYWAERINNEFMIMCADCTGHGVPGAFMSLLAISYLKDITAHLNIQRPDQVLTELRLRFIEGFKYNSNSDGMDASLIKISGTRLEMAAANNPVWIIRNKEAIVIRPDKFPIGKHYGELKEFSLNIYELKAGDLVIMYTDGYADQFGGPKNKKYKYNRLQEHIVKNCDNTMSQLKASLTEEIKAWKGNNEQIDDILIIGIRI